MPLSWMVVLLMATQVVPPELTHKVEPVDDPGLKNFLTDPARIEVTVDSFGKPMFLIG